MHIVLLSIAVFLKQILQFLVYKLACSLHNLLSIINATDKFFENAIEKSHGVFLEQLNEFIYFFESSFPNFSLTISQTVEYVSDERTFVFVQSSLFVLDSRQYDKHGFNSYQLFVDIRTA